MFNVTNTRTENEIIEDDENIIKATIKELFSVHNCIIYILTFLVSMVSIKNEIIPFGLAILGACIGSTVPVFMVFIVSVISTAIFHGTNGVASFLCTSIIFFLLIAIFKPKVSLDDRNEVLKVGVRLFAASFLYNLIEDLRGVFLIYDLFLGLVIAALTYTFYKIFVNGIVVIRDWGKKQAFAVEEMIAVAIILSIAISVLKDITIFELSISNILIIFIILALGWKNGILVGGTSGLSIGLALTLVGNINILQLTVFAVSGILAGALNKLGKVGVILGFLLGNAILTYLANGNTATIIYFREIFVASILLILVPGNAKLKVKDLFDKEKALPSDGDKRFEYYEDVKDKLNGVVETIDEMSNEISTEENDTLKKEIFIDNFIKMFEEYQENIFYDDIIKNEDFIGDMFDEFKKNDVITENIIIEIFKKYNNYILLRDKKIKDDLQELIKLANRTYRQLQIEDVKRKTKSEENKKVKRSLKDVTAIIRKISNEDLANGKYDTKEKELKVLLKGKGLVVNSVTVNKNKNGKYIINVDMKFEENKVREKTVIASIANIISKSFGSNFSFQRDKRNLTTGEYTQIYSSTDKFALQVGSAKTTKFGSKVSGDANLQVRLEDGKYLLAISDGMGSGEQAKKCSKFVVNTLNNLLAKGFEEEDVLKLINSELNLNKNDDMYATADISILDLYLGNISLIKNGACNTYIKSKQAVNVYKSKEMPIGAVEDIRLSSEVAELHEGDIILMCSDGLYDSKSDVKDDWIEKFLKNVQTNSAQKIADLLVSEAIDNSYGDAKDDITVIVAKIIKKH